MAETKMIKKHLIRPFINVGTSSSPEWVQIKKSTEFTRSMNPVTEERDYISDEHPTTEVTDYKPSEGIAVSMYKGEKDFDALYKLYKDRAIGSDAKKEFMIVYIFDSKEVNSKTYYYADKTECSITIDELNSTASQLSATIYENGTQVAGYVEITAEGVPSFTAGPFPEDS